MGKRNPNFKLIDRDLYETPVDVTEALLAARPDIPDTLWEPAAGRGKMADVLGQHRGIYSSDIHPLREDIMPRDFLIEEAIPKFADAIVTNPPWSLAPEFIDCAIQLDLPTFFLLPDRWPHVAANLRFWPYVRWMGMVTFRPKWIEGSANSAKDDVIWIEFGRGDAPARIEPLRRVSSEAMLA